MKFQFYPSVSGAVHQWYPFCVKAAERKAARQKAVPEAIRKRPTPQVSPHTFSTRHGPRPPNEPPAEEEVMEVEDWNTPWTAREKVWVSIKWRNTFKEVKVSRRRSANWSIFCSVQETQALASGLSQQTRGMKKVRASSCCWTRFEAKEEVEALK